MVRITGMNSGLDTETIITELASARSVKVQSMQKKQTKMSWKMDAWKDLNSKIYKFYTSTLDNMRFAGGYSKMLGKHLNLDMGIGFWTGYSRYVTYACPSCGRITDNGNKLFVLPNDLMVALSYIF